jgi:hypothetical protein
MLFTSWRSTLYTELEPAERILKVSDEPRGASDLLQEKDEGIYVEHVSVYGEEADSYEPLRQALNEKTLRGWRVISMVKDPAGDGVDLVWEKRDRKRHE